MDAANPTRILVEKFDNLFSFKKEREKPALCKSQDIIYEFQPVGSKDRKMERKLVMQIVKIFWPTPGRSVIILNHCV